MIGWFCSYFAPNRNDSLTSSFDACRDSIRYHIKNYGPISTGFNVYSDFPGFQDSAFYTFSSSYVWPGTKTYKLLGGHAIMCYGFDDNMLNGVTSTSVGVLFCKNSWGTGWFVSFFVDFEQQFVNPPAYTGVPTDSSRSPTVPTASCLAEVTPPGSSTPRFP